MKKSIQKRIESYCKRISKEIYAKETEPNDAEFIKDIINKIDGQLNVHYGALWLRKWRFIEFEVDDKVEVK